jgi:hypothetical protein
MIGGFNVSLRSSDNPLSRTMAQPLGISDNDLRISLELNASSGRMYMRGDKKAEERHE